MSSRKVLLGRVGIAATSAAILAVGSGALLSPVSADAPVKVGWWNFASGGGQAAPGPGVNPGGIRVSVVSQQPVAYGAVQYALPKDGSATIELAITQDTDTQGLNKVMMCPTKDASWKPGDDQDASGAPEYSCDLHHFVGRLSADGKTMTFLVDGSADVSDGVLSLAVVPLHTTEIPQAGTDPGTGTDLTPPFVMDFDKPGPNSFTSDDSSSSSSDSSLAPPPASGGSGSGAGTGTGTSSGSTSIPAAPPSSGGSSGSDVSLPPATADAPAQSPVVAGQNPAGGVAAPAYTPQAAQKPATTSNSRRNWLWLLLGALGFLVLYTQNQSQRAPRALAGARAGEAGATPLPTPYPAYAAPRGLGRFSKPRERAARPLI